MRNSFAENLTEHEAFVNFTESGFYPVGILELHIFSFSFLVGLPTNAHVIWLIVTGTGSRLASDFFTLNVSICGLFFSLNSLLVFFTKWFLLAILQAVSQFFLGLAITGSPLFQCVICVERYLAVVRPVTFLKSKPLRYRVICCAVAWMITFASCTVCLLSFNSSFFMYMWFLSLQFLVFMSIKFYCCVAVLRALKRSGPGDRKRNKENHIKRRAFIVILLNTVNTSITYIPFAVTGLLSAVTQKLFHFLWSFSYACFVLAGFLPSVLYLHRTGKIYCLCKC